MGESKTLRPKLANSVYTPTVTKKERNTPTHTKKTNKTPWMTEITQWPCIHIHLPTHKVSQKSPTVTDTNTWYTTHKTQQQSPPTLSIKKIHPGLTYLHPRSRAYCDLYVPSLLSVLVTVVTSHRKCSSEWSMNNTNTPLNPSWTVNEYYQHPPPTPNFQHVNNTVSNYTKCSDQKHTQSVLHNC